MSWIPRLKAKTKKELIEIIIKNERNNCTEVLNSPHFTLHSSTRKEKKELREILNNDLTQLKE